MDQSTTHNIGARPLEIYRRLRSLVEEAAGFVCVLDGEGRLEYLNPLMIQALGVLHENWEGVSFQRHVHPTDQVMFAASFEQWLAKAGEHLPVELRLVSNSGAQILFEACPSNLLDDSLVRGIVLRSKYTNWSRGTAERLSLLGLAISEAHDAVLVANAGGVSLAAANIEYANPAMQNLLDDPSSPLVGKPVSFLTDMLSRRNRALAERIGRKLNEGESAQAVLEIRSPNGKTRWLDVRCQPFPDPYGQLRHWISIVRDITAPRMAILLEHDGSRILELIGRNAPIAEIMNKLALMVERQIPGAYVAVFRLNGELLSCEAAPTLPAAYQNWGFPNFSQSDSQLRLSCSVPILSAHGIPLGLVSIFLPTSSREETDQDSLKYAVNLAAIALEHRQMTETLAYQAKYDALTGLPNRNHLESLLPRLIEESLALDEFMALGFLDLDRFKHINDSLGHVVGDLLLKQIGARLTEALMPNDFLARFGGDEFVVVMRNLAAFEKPEDRGRRFLEAFVKPFKVDGYDLHLTASMGVSVYPRDGQDADSLIRNADHAMYRAKNVGKNELEMYAPSKGATPVQRLDLEVQLRQAIDNRELSLNYHPLLTITGELNGFEVLLSWDHPKLGRIAPVDFIPIAEESGLIVSIGSWVLEQACLQAAAWKRAGYAPLQMNVNVSPVQFVRPGFVDIVAAALAVSAFDPRHLTLEITESLVMSNMKEAAEKMAMLRAIGVGIAIDDFGAGYSSLNYLRQLPADQLKIDQSFVREMTSESSPSFSVIDTITTLAHSLRLKVIAEGVEKQEQLDLLAKAGCDFVQGHLFGEPVRAIEAEKLMRQQSRRRYSTHLSN